jgi:hypothetical protein
MREFELYVSSHCSAALTIREHRQAIEHHPDADGLKK